MKTTSIIDIPHNIGYNMILKKKNDVHGTPTYISYIIIL